MSSEAGMVEDVTDGPSTSATWWKEAVPLSPDLDPPSLFSDFFLAIGINPNVHVVINFYLF
jgi:hypothetical protein